MGYAKLRRQTVVWAEPSSNVSRSLLFYCYGGGRRCKAATNSLKFPKIMPPKSLDGDSARVPKVSRASDGKGPFNQCCKMRKLIKRSFFHHCGTIIYCACVVEAIKSLSDISMMTKVIEKLQVHFTPNALKKNSTFVGSFFRSLRTQFTWREATTRNTSVAAG